MRTYTSEFLRQLRDKDNFIEPTRTYFPPWWKFWDKKVKTETSFSGDFIREYDQAGNFTYFYRKRSVLDAGGFGSHHYWEKLDLKTMIITSQPQPGVSRKIFPNGKYEEIQESNKVNIQKQVFGTINLSGEITPYATALLKGGERIAFNWIKKNLKNEDFWKRVVQSYPLSLEEKETLLEKASRDFKKRKRIPKTEERLRAFKDNENKARLDAHKESYRETATREKYNELARRRAARRGIGK